MNSKKRFVSILGDSLSTFEGYNPPGYSVFYDENKQIELGLTSVYDTWWAKVNQKLMAYLCVNNSYSGSKVSGEAFPSGSSTDRTFSLHTNQFTPDIILVYIGFNDFGNGIPIYRTKFLERKTGFFYDSYITMLKQLKHNYPSAQIVCATLMRSMVKNDKNWIFPEKYRGISLEEYNVAIRKAVEKEKVILADLASVNDLYETLDGSHPTAKGHITIANAWMSYLESFKTSY